MEQQIRSRSEASRSTMECVVMVLLLMTCTSWSVVQGQLEVTYNFVEEQRIGALVGDLTADVGFDERYTQEDISAMSFEFVSQQPRHSDKFALRRTGEIITARRVDRDSMCGNVQLCTVDLNVFVQPARYAQMIRVTIIVVDVNDNDPVFPEDSITIQVHEASPVGSAYALPSPYDRDAGTNGIQTYRIHPPTDRFSLRVSDASEDEAVELHLLLEQQLDRETVDLYQLQVMAVDGGTPAFTGTIDVEIVVQDANDNNPRFTNTTYTVTVMEDLPVGSIVTHVRATDADIGDNGELMYSFDDLTLEEHGDQFRVDTLTGEIITLRQLDYETTESYQFTVMARDRGPNSLPSYARVYVHVRDINDHVPEISVDTLTDSGQAEVMEGADAGIFVALIHVVDADSGAYGEIYCSLNSPHFAMTAMYDNRYQVVSRQVFDRESRDLYEATIVCADRGVPPRTSSYDLYVRILDANDHTPTFTHGSRLVEIAENNERNAFITRVNATDGDVGANAQIVYSFEDAAAAADVVNIDPTTGVVTASRALDYEQQSEYIFIIIAADLGMPHPRNSTCTLYLRVLDTNDELPLFVNESYRFVVSEGTRSGTVIGSVVAEDADISVGFREILYLLHDDSSFNGQFFVNPITGAITMMSELDREQQEQYELIVIASNQGFSNKTSEVAVTIIVEDINDNVPQFVFPSRTNQTIKILDNLDVGTEIVQVQTYDLDAGVNSVMQYEIISNETQESLHIDAHTGVISVAQALTTLPYSSIEPTVFVMDQGVPQNVASEQLLVQIQSAMSVMSPGVSDDAWYKDIKLIVIISLVPLLLILVIIIAMCLYRRQQSQSDKAHRYNCRVAEQEKMATIHASPCLKDGAVTPLPPPPDSQVSTPSSGGKGGGDAGVPSPHSPSPRHHVIRLPGVDTSETSTDDMYTSWTSRTNIMPVATPTGHMLESRSTRTNTPILNTSTFKAVKFENSLGEASDGGDVELDDNSLTDSGRGGSEEGGDHSGMRTSPIDRSYPSHNTNLHSHHPHEVSYHPAGYRQPTTSLYPVASTTHHNGTAVAKAPGNHRAPPPPPAPPQYDPPVRYHDKPHNRDVTISTYGGGGGGNRGGVPGKRPAVMTTSYHQYHHTPSPTSDYTPPHRQHNNSNLDSHVAHHNDYYYPIHLYKNNSIRGRDGNTNKDGGEVTRSVKSVVNKNMLPYENKRTTHHLVDPHHAGVDNASDGGTTTSGSYTVDDMDSVMSVEHSQDSVCV